MSNIFKWLYKLGYKHGRRSILITIERARDFEANQAHIKSLEKHNSKFYSEPAISHKEHEQRRIALDQLLTEIEPKLYPSTDKWVEAIK